MLKALLATNPGIEVTPQVLLQFIAEKTKHSPRESPGKNQHNRRQLSEQSPEDSPQEDEDEEGGDATLQGNRGRKPFARGTSSSRSSSRSSAGTSRLPSRPPSVPPKTPVSAPSSAFDTSRRQRSTPLSVTAPSSWTKRPTPASRRKSVDGGSRSSSRASSDTEVSLLALIAPLDASHDVFL